MKFKNDYSTITAWFTALCFYFSTIEYLIPKPLPFLRLGIANIPIMLAMEILPVPSVCVVVFLKIIGQGIIGGTLFSYIFLFSAAGTVASTFIMLLLKKIFKKQTSFIGISVSGAFASNAVQLVLARYFIFGTSVDWIAPPFLCAGLLSGVMLGTFTNRFVSLSSWFKQAQSGNIRIPVTAYESTSSKQMANPGNHFQLIFRFCVGISLLCILIFSKDLLVSTVTVIVSLILLHVDTSRIHIKPIIIMSASIIFFNLLTPFGRLIAQPFGIPLTEGALLTGIKKALLLEGMIFISRWMLQPQLQLPGKIGLLLTDTLSILNHLTRNGIDIDPKHPVQSLDRIMSAPC